MNLTKKPSFKQAALSVVIGLMGFAGVYMPILLLLLPAFFGFLLAAWGGICFLIGALTAAVLTFALLGAADALGMLLVFLPAGIIIGFCLHGKKPYRSAVIGASLALALGYYCLICLPGMLSGDGPFYAMEQLFLGMADMIAAQAQPLTEAGLLLEGDVTVIADTIRSMSLLAPEMTVLSLSLLGMGFGFLDVLIARMLAKNAVQLRPMAPFCKWQLSKQYTAINLTAFFAALICLVFGLNNAGAVLVAAECVCVFPMMLMGVCFLEFLSRIPGSGGKVRRILTYVCVALLLPYSLIFLLLMGFLDRVIRIRKRVRIPGDGEQK